MAGSPTEPNPTSPNQTRLNWRVLVLVRLVFNPFVLSAILELNWTLGYDGERVGGMKADLLPRPLLLGCRCNG